MRPLALRFRAFGPYAEEQVIDFRLLQDRTLFLIHGPTGSGKTSILDAMCFALYGETSGGERDVRQMRSHHVDAEVSTEVTFDFSLGDEVFRVTRSPEQERSRKRGTGTTKERARATLWRRTGLGGDAADGVVIASQWAQVTDEMQRLLGFRSDQFRQVVVLPQGQFRQLLLADSRERQRILEVLFRTEVYRRIEEALKDAAREIQHGVEEMKTRRTVILAQAHVETEEDLGRMREEHAARLAELEERLERLRTSEKEAQDRLDAARDAFRKIQEQDESERALNGLEARDREVREKERELDRARKASSLSDSEANLRKREEEFAEACRGSREAQEAFHRDTVAKTAAQEALEREKGREASREEARQHLDRLTEMTDRVQELEAAELALASASQDVQTCTDAREREKARLDALRGSLQEAREAQDAAREAAGAIPLLQAALEEAKRAHAQALRLKACREELGRASKAHDLAKAGLGSMGKGLSGAREKLDLLEQAWAEGQAAFLAQGLIPGVPCPVCGSTEHPSPATAAHELPTEAFLKKAKKEAKELEARRDEAQTDVGSRLEAVARLSSEIQVLEEALAELKGEAPSDLEKRTIAAGKRLKLAEAAQRQVLERIGQMERLQEEEARGLKGLEQIEQGLREAVAAQGRQEGIVRERLERAPEGLRSTETLQAAIREADQRLRSMVEALEKAREAFNAASRNLAGREEALKAAKVAEATAAARAQEMRVAFILRLREAGFVDEASYQTARLDEARMKRLDVEIQDYRAGLKAAQERLQRARDAARGLKLPDVQALEQQLHEMKAALEKGSKDHGALNQHVRQMEAFLEALRQASSEMEAMEAQYGVVGRIAEVANGRNPLGMTFQRFVLAALLDDVLAVASRRLRLMSKSRFDLQRALERADQRVAGGLDLLVYDGYTGTTRPVNTLSGGESFLASLSLALGLADVVQAHAGGIRLETVFVDEGFGSLDPESLDLAFQALLDLQGSGRLVGIVSHVPELRERIDVRLEVTSGRRGSVASFVL